MLKWESPTILALGHCCVMVMILKTLRTGGRLRDVQDMLGHASLNATQRYLEPSSDAKRKLVELVQPGSAPSA